MPLLKTLEFKDKCVITSDHGYLVDYTVHPEYFYMADLTIVPWCEIDVERLEDSEDLYSRIKIYRRITSIIREKGIKKNKLGK